MRKVYNNHLFFIVISILFLTHCKKGEVIPATFNLITFNLTENDQPVTGAMVYIFDDVAGLELSKGQLKGINATDSTISSDGVASIELDTEKPHWLFIVYKSEEKKLTFTNEGYNNVINTLPKNLDVTVDIKLSAVNGNFAFWTSDSTALPITIVMGSETFTVDKFSATAPAIASDPNTVLVTKLSGTYRYYAKNAKGCVWNEIVKIEKGEFQPKEISKCGTNEITFWSGVGNSTHYPITVVLNDSDTLGTIDRSTSGYICGGVKSEVLSVYRETGKFTYFAYSADKQCAWTGSFDNSQCTNIELKECK